MKPQEAETLQFTFFRMTCDKRLARNVTTGVITSGSQMSQRNEILGRIRDALRLEAHRPKLADASSDGARTGSTPRDWLPVVPNDQKGMAEAFARNCVELRTQ